MLFGGESSSALVNSFPVLSCPKMRWLMVVMGLGARAFATTLSAPSLAALPSTSRLSFISFGRFFRALFVSPTKKKTCPKLSPLLATQITSSSRRQSPRFRTHAPPSRGWRQVRTWRCSVDLPLLTGASVCHPNECLFGYRQFQIWKKSPPLHDFGGRRYLNLRPHERITSLKE